MSNILEISQALGTELLSVHSWIEKGEHKAFHFGRRQISRAWEMDPRGFVKRTGG
jgi:hypothetical protein